MNLIVISLITLGVIGCLAAVILYFVAQKFKVEEDPRIDHVNEALPGANCGGCGFPGCRGFAEACVKAETLDGLSCPVGGGDTMSAVASILGKVAVASEPKIAVLRCNGTCENRPRQNRYDGAKSCHIVHNLYTGETGCRYGCVGCGDCVAVCQFGAMHMDPQTGLPVIDEEKCTACNACVKECPKQLLELRRKGPKSRRIYVACANKDKGGVARKACKAACIGCSKCFKECKFDAIVVENNLAYIDSEKCKLCRKCVDVCPTNAIIALNFPPRPPKVEKTAETASKVETQAVTQTVEAAPKAETATPVAPAATSKAEEAPALLVAEAVTAQPQVESDNKL